MHFSFQGSFYKLFIDPVLSGLHHCVAEKIEPSQRVMDVACGTGSLSIVIARKAKYITGIDLSKDIVITARSGASNALPAVIITGTSETTCKREAFAGLQAKQDSGSGQRLPGAEVYLW